MTHRWTAGLMGILFFASVAGSWAWFHVGPPPAVERLRFEVGREVAGWRFVEQPLGEAVRETLATPHLFNGVFKAGPERSVTVFAAEWTAETTRQMSVVQHTPDVCWVGAGWVPVRAGQPDRVDVDLGGRVTPFECRLFELPQGRQRELVLWCTLVGGQLLEESDRWSVETDGAQARDARFAMAGRRMAAGQLVDNIRNRRRATAQKQFVRFSVPVSADWEQGLAALRAFAPVWLQLRQDPAP